MFKIKTVSEQLIEERNKNKILSEKTEQLTADIDFVAMMCGVELEEDENE